LTTSSFHRLNLLPGGSGLPVHCSSTSSVRNQVPSQLRITRTIARLSGFDTMEQETKVWIILGSVLGVLVLLGVTVAVLFCWKRNQRRVRGFSLRAVTPLDDAEFESWRRPSQYTQRPEKYGIQPVVTRDRISPIKTMFEKELHTYESPRTPSPDDLAQPLRSPSSSIRKPERVRRKSSVTSSIADRPPTPYSPTSPSSEFQRTSTSSRKSQPLIHYPSVSEASAFKFELKSEYGTHQQGTGRWI
jgi:hypothetical protein